MKLRESASKNCTIQEEPGKLKCQQVKSQYANITTNYVTKNSNMIKYTGFQLFINH